MRNPRSLLVLAAILRRMAMTGNAAGLPAARIEEDLVDTPDPGPGLGTHAKPRPWTASTVHATLCSLERRHIVKRFKEPRVDGTVQLRWMLHISPPPVDGTFQYRPTAAHPVYVEARHLYSAAVDAKRLPQLPATVEVPKRLSIGPRKTRRGAPRRLTAGMQLVLDTVYKATRLVGGPARLPQIQACLGSDRFDVAHIHRTLARLVKRGYLARCESFVTGAKRATIVAYRLADPPAVNPNDPLAPPPPTAIVLPVQQYAVPESLAGYVRAWDPERYQDE